MNEMILLTGRAGFIGSNYVHAWLDSAKAAVVNLDKLTYAGILANLEKFKDDPRHVFVQGDMGDLELVESDLLASRCNLAGQGPGLKGPNFLIGGCK